MVDTCSWRHKEENKFKYCTSYIFGVELFTKASSILQWRKNIYSLSLYWTSCRLDVKSSLCCTLVSRSVEGSCYACSANKRQYATRIQMSDLWVTYRRLCRDWVSHTSVFLLFFLFLCFNSWVKPLNHNVGANPSCLVQVFPISLFVHCGQT